MENTTLGARDRMRVAEVSRRTGVGPDYKSNLKIKIVLEIGCVPHISRGNKLIIITHIYHVNIPRNCRTEVSGPKR